MTLWHPAMLLGAFATGVATSIGPCCGTRWFAVWALCRGRSLSARAALAAALALGIVAAYVGIATASPVTLLMRRYDTFAYAVGCVLLVLQGIGLLRASALHEAERCEGPRHAASWSAASLIGLVLGSIGGTCCMPALAVIASSSMVAGDERAAAVTTAAFALGHLAPMIVFAALPASFPLRGYSEKIRRSASLVHAAVLIGGGLFYGALA